MVTFEDVDGMTELNGKEFKIKIIDKTHFTIGDTRSFSPHSDYASGYVRRINVPKKIEFLEFSEAIKNPSTMQQQFDTTNQSRQVILSFIALQNLLEKSDKNLIEITGDELFECTQKVNSEIQIVDEINEQLIREFARECGSIISPMCSVIGGIVSQEIIKLLISKFTPIHQFFSIDYTKSLPKNTEYKLMNDRYDSYRIVFGNMQHEEMEKLSYLIVGFGSIGSELLKNLALMGFATKNEGQILTIDKGLIKKSDLNRNFLLKNEDIGKMRSEVVKQAVNSINPNVNISSKQLEINNETDLILSDKFYELFDGICGTMKNEKHENFLNSKCTFYNKPFLVSQTQGMKAVYQTIVPRITNCFENQLNNLFPLLELSGVFNFPKKYDQCCLFGILTYMQLFEKDPQLICSFFDGLIPKDSKINIDEKSKYELSIIKKFYIDEKCENFEDCIKWARMKFENLFNFHIQSLIENLPKNVWSHCLIPKSTTFDVNDENHIKFIKSASLLRAKVCQIEPTKIDIIQTAAQFDLSELAHEEKGVFNEEDFKNLYADQILQQTKLPKPEMFSKENNYDNDYSNVCFDFISSTVKIYSHIYKIKNNYDVDDDLEIKQYFRKIVPSLITTNSMIAGFVALEMYKIHCIDNDKQLSDFRSGEIDLSVPCFKVKEPEPCRYIECTKNNMKFTLWDKWEIEGNLTVNEFIEKVREKYNVNICMIAYKAFLIYSENLNQNRLNSKIVDIITNDFKNPIIDDKRYLGLDCVCIDDNDVDVEIPIISLVPFPK